LLLGVAAVLVSFVGVSMSRSEKAFIAWFGSKGVASMLLALLVLMSTESDRTLVFEIAAYTVLASILAHGLTDTVGTRWMTVRASGQAGPAR
jgi:NhaP-type Na+/H+ and K+/H+ antiporter